MMSDHDPLVSFRPLARDDFPVLSAWLSRPHVQQWWPEAFDAGAIEERYQPVLDGTDPTECFVVECDGVAIGFIQRYLLMDNPEWGRILAVAGTPADGAGIDFFIGDEMLIGVGIGPKMIDRFVETTWPRYPLIPAIVVNVSSENRRSWRALERAGFTRVWSGLLQSDDPSDEGLNHVYLRRQPENEDHASRPSPATDG
jgi:aminoglycoside 6'-N-acetyltransferase